MNRRFFLNKIASCFLAVELCRQFGASIPNPKNDMENYMGDWTWITGSLTMKAARCGGQ